MPEKLQKDIDRVYQGLQHMQVEPTKANLAILLDAMQTLEVVYNFLGGLKASENAEAEAGEDNDA